MRSDCSVGRHPAVRLVIADVDGTLVTPDKVLTTHACAAVRAVLDAGIAFTITSGRPPRGMKMLIDDLKLQHPIAAFNGGVLVNPDLSVIRQYFLPADFARQVIKLIENDPLDVWVYTDKDWFVYARHGPHVDREEWTVKFPPVVVSSYDTMLDRVVKIVGISDDYEAVARCEKDVQQECGNMFLPPGLNLTTSMSPTRTPTKTRWGVCCPRFSVYLRRISPRSATCRTLS